MPGPTRIPWPAGHFGNPRDITRVSVLGPHAMNRLLLVSALAACGSSSSKPDALIVNPMDGSNGSGSDAAVPTMNINGTSTAHFVTDSGVMDLMPNLSNVTFASVTPNTAGTAFVHESGTGNSDGTFVVPVPQGATSWDLGFTFQAGAALSFMVGNSTSPDLSQFILGRPDVAIASGPTTLTVSATGLTAWATTDDLELFSSNAGAIFFSPQNEFTTPLAAGNTTITSQPVSWTDQTVNLVDGTKGDSLMLFQLTQKTSGTDTYSALTKLGSTTGLTQTSGQSSDVSFTLAAVPQNETLAVHWKRSQFEALAAQGGPGAVDDGLSLLALDAMPGATTRGFFANAPDLVEFTHPPTGSTDIDETFTYGNPFTTGGTAWDEFLIISYQFNAPVKAAAASSATHVTTGYYANALVSDLKQDGTIAPVINGVGTITVGGMDVTSTAQAGVGMTPKITWTAPTVGTPMGYTVEIQAVGVSAGTTSLGSVGTFFTKDTSLQVPDMILQSGMSYIVEIFAVTSAGADYTAKPFISPLPYAQFATISAQFKP